MTAKVVKGMSTTPEQDYIAGLSREPGGEVRYLSDGTGLQPEVAAAEQHEVAAAGRRLLKATGGDACLVLVGPLVSEIGKENESTESAIVNSCMAQFD